MKGYTEEDLADLTQEERDALNEGDGNDDGEGDGDDADNAGNGQDNGHSGEDGEGDPDGNDKADEPDSSADQDASPDADPDADDAKPDADGQQPSRDDGKDPEQGADPAPATKEVREPAQVFVAEAPKDSEQQLTELKNQKNSLADQFDDGDITAREYNQKLDELNRQERQIERDIDRARLSSDMEKQREKNAWEDAQSEFISEHPEYDEDAVRREMFNAVLRSVASREEFVSMPVSRANSAKLLRAAHEAFTNATGGVAKKEDGQQKAEGNTQKPKPKLPPTLAGVPAADVTDTNNGRWASLDSLREKDYEAYEEKLFSMTEADRAAYLADDR